MPENKRMVIDKCYICRKCPKCKENLEPYVNVGLDELGIKCSNKKCDWKYVIFEIEWLVS